MAEIETATALAEALKKCVGGETLYVTGKLSPFAIWNRRFLNPVTIECVDGGMFDMAEDPAVPGWGGAWNSALMLVNVGGLILRNVIATGVKLPNLDFLDPAKKGSSQFDYRGGGLGVDNVDDILVDGGFYGQAGIGIGGARVRNFTVQDARINGSNFGIQIGGGGDINTRTVGTRGVKILRNRITDFDINAHRGDHPDGIMIFTGPPWTEDWGPSMCPVDITVDGNLVAGNGPNQPQGIFFRDAGGQYLDHQGRLPAEQRDKIAANFPRSQDFWFEQIRVRRNTVLACMWNHISWERLKAAGSDISENFVALCRIDPVKYAGHPYLTNPTSQGRLTGDVIPETFKGNRAHWYGLPNVPWGEAPAENSKLPEISEAEAAKIIADWCASNKAGRILMPGDPTPAPGPVPTPTPPPTPAPAPPAPLADQARKARVEVNAAENGLGRARYALDQALKSLEVARVSKARLEVNASENALGRAIYALDKILAGLGG